MKKIVLFLFFITSASIAQIVNIPDPNFKAKLLSLGLDINGDGEIQNSEALLEQALFLENSNIQDLTGLESFTNLSTLFCSNNQITNIDLVNGMNNLSTIDAENNLISNVNITNLQSCTYMYLYGNPINELNIVGLPNLLYLSFDPNIMATLTLLSVIDCPNVRIDSIANMDLLTSVVIKNCFTNDSTIGGSLPNLAYLDVSGSRFEIIEIFSAPLLEIADFTGTKVNSSVRINNTSLTSLDLSQLIYIGSSPIGYTEIEDHLFLQNLNLKNGYTDNIYCLSSNPNLLYVCADESDLQMFQYQLDNNSGCVNPNMVFNSYCNFSQGGNHNTISGDVYFDSNNDGCSSDEDLYQSNIRIDVTNGSNVGATYTSPINGYKFYTLAGEIVMTPNIENSEWFSIFPQTVTIPFLNSNNNAVTQNFCITPLGNHSDVEVIIVPITRSRPGFDAVYKLVFRNKGNQTLSGVINFIYNDSFLDFISASIAPNSISNGNLSWNYTDLNPFENRSVTITLNVNSPMEEPAVNINDVLSFSASISPSEDSLPLDNYFFYNETVIGSYDPNDKACLEGAIVSTTRIGEFLHYNINFENTGTADAIFIVVKDLIDTEKLEINSLQVMNSSHQMTTRVTGNNVEFIFDNINLGPNEHGNVVFKIKTKSALEDGDSVSNNAKIYFDYNFPIQTNTVTSIFQSLSSESFVLDNSILIFPNPAKDNIIIDCDSNIKTIQLFDIQGRLLETQFSNSKKSQFNLSDKFTGIYFVKVITDNGEKVEKIIKE